MARPAYYPYRSRQRVSEQRILCGHHCTCTYLYIQWKHECRTSVFPGMWCVFCISSFLDRFSARWPSRAANFAEMTALGQGWIAMPKLPSLCSAPTPTEETTTPTHRKIQNPDPPEFRSSEQYFPVGLRPTSVPRPPCIAACPGPAQRAGTHAPARGGVHSTQLAGHSLPSRSE